MPNLPPRDVGFMGMKEPLLMQFKDALEQNHRLENAEPLSRGIRDSSSLGYLKVNIFNKTITSIYKFVNKNLIREKKEEFS